MTKKFSESEGPGRLLLWLRRDKYTIFLCLIVLLIAMIALFKVQDAVQACNIFWQEKIKDRCTCTWDIQNQAAPQFNLSILDQYNSS